MNCGVGCRHGSDPELQCLWCRPVATALTQPLAREPPYATGAALKKTKKKKKPTNLQLHGTIQMNLAKVMMKIKRRDIKYYT